MKRTAFGLRLPVKPSGIIYRDKEQSFHAWSLSDNLNREPQSIVRLNTKQAPQR
jgi:hypothetical protein